MAGSLLHAIGLPELVTYSAEAYEALALRLATEPALLDAVRRKLGRQHQDSPAVRHRPFYAPHRSRLRQDVGDAPTRRTPARLQRIVGPISVTNCGTIAERAVARSKMMTSRRPREHHLLLETIGADEKASLPC